MNNVYIFDMDDTLVDSMIRFDEGVFSVLNEDGIAYDRLKMIATTIPLGVSGSARYFHDVLGVRGTVDEIVRRIEDSMYRLYCERIFPKAGVAEYLNRKHREGNRLFVLTATPHTLTDPCLKTNGLFDLFERVLTTDDFGIQKNDVRLFDEVAKELAVSPSDILYFDDSMTAINNAKTAGYRTYGVYSEHSEEEIRYIKEHHDGFVRSFENLTV